MAIGVVQKNHAKNAVTAIHMRAFRILFILLPSQAPPPRRYPWRGGGIVV
jgi:hypothetical protein